MSNGTNVDWLRFRASSVRRSEPQLADDLEAVALILSNPLSQRDPTIIPELMQRLKERAERAVDSGLKGDLDRARESLREIWSS